MPPPKPPRMTANPVKPARYRPGKAVAESRSSSSDEEDEQKEEGDGEDSDTAQTRKKQQAPPPPKATSFPSADAKRVTNNLKNVDLNARRRQAEAQERAKKAEEYSERQRAEREAGFVTESESGSESESESESDDEPEDQDRDRKPPPPRKQQQQHPSNKPTGSESAQSSSEEDDSSGSEESDSSDSSAAPPTRRAAPVFIRKDQRSKPSASSANPAVEESTADPEAAAAARRAAETDAMVQEHLERDALARAAGKKSWDDDEPDAEGQVDDTDGLDPELEHAQWVARELARLKRSRAAIEEREAELAEVERRRALTTPEREAEDRAKVDAQNEEKKARGKAGFMQRYHHKGAFYHDEDEEGKGLLQRDLMGATYESGGGQGMKEALPQYLQVRDATMIGRKGRTRYRDLKTEDTGRWGGDMRRGGGGKDGAFVDDERFRPDRDSRGPTGANASSVGERKRPFGDDASSSRPGEAKRPRQDVS